LEQLGYRVTSVNAFELLICNGLVSKMKCIGIIWNCAFGYKKDIINDIKNEIDIINTYEIDLGDHYEEFVSAIYNIEVMAKWKIERKINSMKQYRECRSVVIIELEISDLSKYFHEKKNKEVFYKIEMTKQKIREKYKHKIKNYIFDNILHLTDNEFEFEETLKVIEQFKHMLSENSI